MFRDDPTVPPSTTPPLVARPDSADAEHDVSRRAFLKTMAAWLAGGTAAAMAVTTGVDVVSSHTASAPTQPDLAGKRLRRWAMVIDLRRCDGCQSVGKPPQCTEACIQGHLVPQPMEWIQVFEAPLPGGGTHFIPTPCQQCQNPPCVNVCPVAATFTTPEGVVLIDQKRCIGCRICMEACPYDRRFFNWGEPPQPPQAMFMEYSPEHQTAAFKGTVMKCDFCPDMARTGRLPYCAQACPNNAIYYGDLEEDLATNGVEVVQLSSFLSENSTYRQKEELGTEPRVFYIPGHGELVGRDAYSTGRMATVWPWQEKVSGVTWSRDGR